MSESLESISEKISSLEGWLNLPVVSLLHRLCSALGRESLVVEIGSWKAKSTVLLGLSSPPCARIIAIDPHTGSGEHQDRISSNLVDTFGEFQANLRKHQLTEKIEVIRKRSDMAVSLVPFGIDMLWIDGSHDYEDVRGDFVNYFAKLKVGGVVAMHDYKWAGVKRLTWELLEDSSLPIGLVRRVEDTHFFYRTEKPSSLFHAINLSRLFVYRSYQAWKKKKRKFRKWQKKKLGP